MVLRGVQCAWNTGGICSVAHDFRSAALLGRFRRLSLSLMVIPLISLIALWAYAATSTIGGAFAQRAYDTENNATGGPDSALLDQQADAEEQAGLFTETPAEV